MLAVFFGQFSCSRQNSEVAALYQELGKLYEAGRYQEAIPLAERALALTEKARGEEAPETATCLDSLGSLYRETGAYAKAEPLIERALKIREKVLGPDAPETADSLTSLAMLSQSMANYAKAEPLYQRALRINEKAFGSEHTRTAISLINLATFYLTTHDQAKAVAYAERAFRINERVLEDGHPDTTAALVSLAVVYEQVGNYARAEPLIQRAVKICEKALGPEHPDTALYLTNLAKLHEDMGNYAQAEPIILRALKIREKIFGPEHPDTANTLDILAQLDQHVGKYTQAEPLYQRALQIREKVLGPEDAGTTTSLNNLAGLYQDMGDYAKAESLYKRVVRIDEKVSGPENPNTATGLSNLAVLYRNIGDYGKAEPLLRRALSIQEKSLGPEHSAVATTLNNLAELYKEIGDYAKTEPLLQRALSIRERALGPEHPDTAQSLSNLAVLYQDIGDYDKAEPLLQRALSIRENVLGPEHPDTANSLNNLAELYQEIGGYAKAEPLLQRSLAICEKAFGPEHPNTAAALNNLAELYRDLDDYAKAEPLIQRALEVREKVLGPEHPDTALSLNSLGVIHQQMNDYAMAESLLKRSSAIYEKVLGPEHPITGASFINLAALELDASKIPETRVLALQSEKAQLRVLSNILSFCSEPQRLAYQNTMSPYTLFAAIDGSSYELASICLRYKGVVLDSIIEDRLLATRTGNKEDQDLIQRLNSDKQRLGQILLETPKVSADQSTTQIQELEQTVEQIEGKLARRVVGLGRSRRALAVTVEEVQAALPKNAALVEYVRYQHYLGKRRLEPRYGAISLTAQGKPHWVCLGKADEIEKSVRRYRNQVADPETSEQTLNETLHGLCDQVWAPIAQSLPEKTRTVIISPDGQLNFISFATLLTSKDRFLAEDHLIEYASSGRDLLCDTKLAANSRLIVFGNPDFDLKAVPPEKGGPPIGQQLALHGKTREALEDVEFHSLLGTKDECAVLAERAKQWRWPCSWFLAEDATEAELRKVRSPHILHLATHGFVLDAQKQDHRELGLTSSFETKKSRYLENPMHRAGLALAGAQATIDAWRRGETPPTEDDGIVTAEEVGALNLQGTWLVTLSACNTGGGEAKSGEGVLGLRRGFIQAGAKNLLMTLWPIADETTVYIMAQFYEAAHKSGNAPQALAEVQRDWLVKLRKTNGLVKAVNLAGPFILSSQGKP